MFKKNLVLDCFTVLPYVYKHAKIQSAVKFYPEWWKELAKKPYDWIEHYHNSGNLSGLNTMKHCIGLTDYFKNSIVLPNWSELRLVIGEEGTDYYQWQFSDGMSNIENHSIWQHGNAFPNEQYQHFKILSPWIFRANLDIKWLFTDPTWHNLKYFPDIRVLPGMMEFHNSSHANVNCFVKRKPEKVFLELPLNTPLWMATPMTERKVKIKNHLVSQEEIEKIMAGTVVFPVPAFNQAYKKIKNMNRGKS